MARVEWTRIEPGDIEQVVGMHGVYTGEFFGIAPTGRETEVRSHDFHEIVDGRIVRTHHMEDWLGWFQQVGSWRSN